MAKAKTTRVGAKKKTRKLSVTLSEQEMAQAIARVAFTHFGISESSVKDVTIKLHPTEDDRCDRVEVVVEVTDNG